MILVIVKLVILLIVWGDNISAKSVKPIMSMVLVTTHIYDGVRSFPLDVELYQKADNLPDGKDDSKFQKKTRNSF